jgi:hypothetical protein
VENTTTPLNAPVITTPLSNEEKQAENHSHNSLQVKQSPFGFLICEQCGKEEPRKTHNQRFCCSECRITAWEFKVGKKIVKGNRIKVFG